MLESDDFLKLHSRLTQMGGSAFLDASYEPWVHDICHNIGKTRLTIWFDRRKYASIAKFKRDVKAIIAELNFKAEDIEVLCFIEFAEWTHKELCDRCEVKASGCEPTLKEHPFIMGCGDPYCGKEVGQKSQF